MQRFEDWFEKSPGRLPPPPRDEARYRSYRFLESGRCLLDQDRCVEFVGNMEDLLFKKQRRLEYQQQKAARQEEISEAWSLRSDIIASNNLCYENRDFGSMIRCPTLSMNVISTAVIQRGKKHPTTELLSEKWSLKHSSVWSKRLK
mmetsp:Transcript_18545/g.30904  ORF Transcript_18545/g.30904 Transcript_18545/m.30904 type:complete len:146 (+) Transcript_18545:240-677(+)